MPGRFLLAALIGALAALWSLTRPGDPALFPASQEAGVTVYLLDNGFHTDLAVPRAALHSRGQTRSYATRGDSGNPVLRHFCGECGSPLYSEVAVLPDLQFVRAASLDDPAAVGRVGTEAGQLGIGQ